MDEIKQNHHGHGAPGRDRVPHENRPYWKRVHRDWKFWGALFLMFVAMIIYVMSNDLTLRPHKQAQQPLSGAVGK
jgi:hypothetical protein